MSISRPLRILSRAFGPGVFPHQMSWFLDLPGRGLIMSAKTVADRLPLEADARVLEVGPGSGYYSVEVGKRIPDGTLSLLDIQPEMLKKCAQRLRASGVTNHQIHLSEGDAMPFDDGCFDVIFMVTVFGEIEGRDALLSEAARVLRPGGVLSITEHHPDPDFEPVHVVAEVLRQHGFVPSERLGWRWAYTLNATRPDQAG